MFLGSFWAYMSVYFVTEILAFVVHSSSLLSLWLVG